MLGPLGVLPIPPQVFRWKNTFFIFSRFPPRAPKSPLEPPQTLPRTSNTDPKPPLTFGFATPTHLLAFGFLTLCDFV